MAQLKHFCGSIVIPDSQEVSLPRVERHAVANLGHAQLVSFALAFHVGLSVGQNVRGSLFAQ